MIIGGTEQWKDDGTVLLRRATVPVCMIDPDFRTDVAGDLGRYDILIDSGVIRRISTCSEKPESDVPVVDLDGGMLWPALVDMHTHLDKGHIWARRPNPDGTFEGALTSVGEDRSANWTADDVRTRMEFSLRCAYAHGTCAIRTHLDSIPPQDEISWPVFEELRREWAGRIDLQAVALFGIDMLQRDPSFLERIVDRVARAGGLLGAVTYMIPELDQNLDLLFQAAIERGLDLDFHVDETGDPNARSLHHIAEAALRNGFEGKVVCGHCCSLSRQSNGEAEATLDLVAQAGLGVVSLPLCNMYLQDRNSERTPRWRGVTLLHEMKARGIEVAVASDNTRDPFYAYGDLDLIEVFREATRILHFDHPVGTWPNVVAGAPASMMSLSERGWINEGAPADLILFRARTWTELLSRPQSDRVVLRAGKPIDRQLPDYRELDHLMRGA